jgi:PERQ amino acid-rich with GYF domain-containing protein
MGCEHDQRGFWLWLLANLLPYCRTRNRANGATQTFRRPSLATNAPNTRESNHVVQGNATSNSGVYVPPHLNANHQINSLRNGTAGEVRYTKDQLITLYKQQRDAGALDQNLSAIFTGGWDPLVGRDSTSSAWGRRDDGKESSVGPEICWDHSARAEPLALIQPSDEEREVCSSLICLIYFNLTSIQLFSSSVNSPIKPPQNPSKDTTGNATLGRKISTSISQNNTGSLNIASPVTGRPGPRRRETSDSYSANNPLSPTGGGRFFRDEPCAAPPPASLLRRKTDFKEGNNDPQNEQKEKDPTSKDGREETSSPFGSLKRRTTGPLSAGLNVPSSPWAVAPPSAGFGSMGTFGSFALGQSSAASDFPEQRSGFGSMRGESRFKGLLSKGSSEDLSSPVVKEKSSISSLRRLPKVENDGCYQTREESLRSRPGRSDTNPYGDDVSRTGMAPLGNGPNNGQGVDQLGFSAFALPPNPGARDFSQSSANQDSSSYHQTPQSRQRGQETMSPTNTNPYQSPEADRRDNADHEHDSSQMQQRGNHGPIGRDEPGVNVFGSLRRGASSALDDRSQTSSAGPTRGFGGLGGLGGFPGFGSSAWSGATGTPNKERGGFPSGFADPVFGMGDLQSPNIPGLGSNNFFGAPAVQNAAAANRSSKIGSVFPQALPDQFRGDKTEGDGLERQADFATRSRGVSGLDGTFAREQEANIRGPSGLFADVGGQDTNVRVVHGTEDSRYAEGLSSFAQTAGFGSSQNPITSPGLGQATNATAPGDMAAQAGQDLSQSSGSPASSQLPAAQQRQMVMPDRMRWIYRDPSGTTQGPWSGLEMHDWFKAGFFTAELQVKKLEDAEYEPLAQLVRRIGNSREPFLVPQIGVPHGPTASSQGNPWAAQSGSSVVSAGPPQPGGAQPPFASSFPSFGTTLTAEQQNALERRKQEEQYLMARQKEHLAQHQVLLKQMQLQGGPHPLHSLQHHSSAHSLHSQPSLGSITSPSGYQPSPIQGPIQPPQNGSNFLEGSVRQPQQSQFGSDFRGAREEDLPNLLDRMNVSRGAPFTFGSGPFGQQQDNGQPPPQTASMLQDRARLQIEQQQADLKSQGDGFREGQGFNERLREFNALRARVEDDDINLGQQAMTAPSIGAPGQWNTDQQIKLELHNPPIRSAQAPSETEGLSLLQQVKITAAATGQQPVSATEESAWDKMDMGLPPSLPPPPTASPLPAPSARRNRQNVADNLVADSRSQSQTPVDTPSASIAPWAEKTSESSKGPSLKEIQEAEARKAAQQEEITAAARKAEAEQERLVHPIPPAPGLPSTSTWANAGTTTTPTSPNTNVWAKQVTGKAPATATAASTKKTLAQIQREEEARKQRQATAANQQTANNAPAAAAGKRYADLASKAAAVPAAPSPPAGAWTTVGLGGKAKAPTTVVATPQVGGRTVSGTAQPTAAPPARSRPSVQTRSSTNATNQNKAADEFTRWAKTALGKGLNGTINGEQSDTSSVFSH